MDRNSIIGFILLVILAGGYIFWNNHEKSAWEAQMAQRSADSLALALKQHPVTPATAKPADTTAIAKIIDTTLAPALRDGTASDVNISNGELNVTFSTKGGFPVDASLANFKTYKGGGLHIFKGVNGNKLSFNIPVDGKTVATDQLFFTP